jgi:hypothetical protein
MNTSEKGHDMLCHEKCTGRILGQSMMLGVDTTTWFDVGPCRCWCHEHE